MPPPLPLGRRGGEQQVLGRDAAQEVAVPRCSTRHGAPRRRAPPGAWRRSSRWRRKPVRACSRRRRPHASRRHRRRARGGRGGPSNHCAWRPRSPRLGRPHRGRPRSAWPAAMSATAWVRVAISKARAASIASGPSAAPMLLPSCRLICYVPCRELFDIYIEIRSSRNQTRSFMVNNMLTGFVKYH